MFKKKNNKVKSDHPVLDFFYNLFRGKMYDKKHGLEKVRRVYFSLNFRLIAFLVLMLGLNTAIMGWVIYGIATENPTLTAFVDFLRWLMPASLHINPYLVFMVLVALTNFQVIFLLSRFIHRFVRRLNTVERGARKLGQGNLDFHIALPHHDELGRLADFLNNMAAGLREKMSMEKFISSSTRTMIKSAEKTGVTISPGTWKREELSFFFADVRGFTSFAESNLPEEVMATLNAYFDLQYKVIQRFSGDVDDYVGDQVMAHFSKKDNKEQACRAAVAIMIEVRAMNHRRRREGLPTFEIGAGVHSGDVVTGNIGASRRMDFACVGDAVNTTARLCQCASPGEILVSLDHFADFPHLVEIGRSFYVKLKGKKAPLKAYQLLDVR